MLVVLLDHPRPALTMEQPCIGRQDLWAAWTRRLFVFSRVVAGWLLAGWLRCAICDALSALRWQAGCAGWLAGCAGWLRWMAGCSGWLAALAGWLCWLAGWLARPLADYFIVIHFSASTLFFCMEFSNGFPTQSTYTYYPIVAGTHLTIPRGNA